MRPESNIREASRASTSGKKYVSSVILITQPVQVKMNYSVNVSVFLSPSYPIRFFYFIAELSIELGMFVRIELLTNVEILARQIAFFVEFFL